MDWAGTAIDFGCFAPLHVFIRVFSEQGVDITIKQARAPMGLMKKDHIRAILEMQEVSDQFTAAHGRLWNECDIDTMYASFETHLFATLKDFTTPIPGVIETMKTLRDQGIKIASTTGYTDAMMEIVTAGAAAQGYTVDNLVTPSRVPAGRPAPYMIFQNMMDLGISCVDEVVKVGDTLSDIEEALNAGVIAIGIITGSNELGLTLEEYETMDENSLNELKEEVAQRMFDAGADYVLDSIRDLPACIESINNLYTNPYLEEES